MNLKTTEVHKALLLKRANDSRLVCDRCKSRELSCKAIDKEQYWAFKARGLIANCEAGLPDFAAALERKRV